MATKKVEYRKHKAAMVILEALIEHGVWYVRSPDDGRHRIDLDTLTGNRARNRNDLRNHGFVCGEIDDILAGRACNVCGDEIEPSDQRGEPVCFDCWIGGRESPKFRERAVRQR